MSTSTSLSSNNASLTSTLSHYRNLAITNILLLGFDFEKYGLTDKLTTSATSTNSNNNTSLIFESLSHLDIKKFDSILHYLFINIYGANIFIDCWPLLNDKSRTSNYRNCIMKLLEELNNISIIPSKLVKKTLINSTICNDEKHWQLLLYLSNYTIIKSLDNNYLTSVYTPANELLISTELNLIQIQAFDVSIKIILFCIFLECYN